MAERKKSSGRKKTQPRALAEFDAGCCREHKVDIIAGVDEAGRGALAGPVVAAVVVLGRDAYIEGLNDSKQLSEKKRLLLFPEVVSQAHAVGVGWATAREIDQINILQATHLAVARALEVMRASPEVILTDYLKLKNRTELIVPLVKGDARSQSIAAASIIAKVTRDRLMCLLHQEYPEYGFDSHKGYGAKVHLDALRDHGSSTIHRHTFRGVDWFDMNYHRSRTLTQLLEETGEGSLSSGEIAEVWKCRGHHLPECEEEEFCGIARKHL